MTAGLRAAADRLMAELLRGRLRYDPLELRCSRCGLHPGQACHLATRLRKGTRDPVTGRQVVTLTVRVWPDECPPHAERVEAARKASVEWARREARRRARASWGG